MSLSLIDPNNQNRLFFSETCAVLFGTLAVTAEFVRMLEMKIKWATRLIIIGCCIQSFFTVSLLVAFGNLTNFILNLFSCCCSIVASGLTLYHHQANKKHANQQYSWVLLDLSLGQRQFILILILLIFYINVMSFIYTFLEGWGFHVALYWTISTITTIGFGDYAPKTFSGKLCFPPLAFIGICVVGTFMFSLRQVILEFLAIKMASFYHETFVDDISISRKQRTRRLSDSLLYLGDSNI